MFELSGTLLIESIVSVTIILVILVITITAYYFRHKSKQIKKFRADLDLLKEDILSAEKEFKIEYDKDLYFSKKTLHLWKEKWKHVEAVVKRFRTLRHNWQIQAIDNDDLLNSILYVNQIFANGMELVKERNSAFIERECVAFRALFDTLEPYPLTQSQRQSIITDECNNLVVAGAGSGKTSTIVGKVKYIVEKGLAKPEEILLLAFAREAKKEMEERMSSRLTVQPDIKTFHALGLNIITKSEEIQPSVTKLKDPPKLREFIKRIISFDKHNSLDKFIDETPAENKEKDLRELLTTYFAYYLRPYRSVFKFTSLGEYIDYIKDNQIRSLKGDLVKSYEECEIANFLYLNGINYIYEKDYEIQTASRERRQYKPDFYLPDYGIYIEHFGINKKGEPAPFVNAEEYLREMAWKRSIHKEHGTTLIETFSYEKTDGVLLSNLEKTLKSHGVKFQKIPEEEIFEKINKLGIVVPFVDLQAKFLNLFKSSNLTLNQLREKTKKYGDWQRYQAFLDIFERVYKEYMAYLQQTQEIDFNDMINNAADCMKKQQFPLGYKYILVDEFQDISQSRYHLLKSMLDKNPSCKSLCVGDDWQSIYRFTGSDLSIMTNFPEYFGFNEQIYLDQTFRFNDKICDFSSKFITKNKDQISKKLVSNTNIDSPAITIVWSKGDNEKRQNEDLFECLNDINSREKGKTSVFIIGRYTFSEPKRLPEIQRKFPKLTIEYYTAHKSKGRQADYVIIVDLKSDRLGFPCKIQDDPILNLVLAKEDTYPDAEERRLFYVAITRAKKHAYLLADSTYPSSFIKEILRDDYEFITTRKDEFSMIHCPRCQTGFIIKRAHAGYSCNNYPYCEYEPRTCPHCGNGFLFESSGSHDFTKFVRYYICSNAACSFKIEKCPRCKDGYLIVRKSRYSRFLGCSNHPACKYTRSLS